MKESASDDTILKNNFPEYATFSASHTFYWQKYFYGEALDQSARAEQRKTIEPEFPPNKKGLHMKLSAEDAFRLYGDRVFSAAFSVTGNQADADDAVQDTYLRYCSYNKEFADEDHLRAWLLRVAINRARDQKRSFWEKHRGSWEDYMETLSFEAPEDKSLFEAVMSLPAKYRTVIHLFYYEDYSVARIAEILHSREGTVKSQLNRGRQLLKTKLMEAWNDDE